MSIRRREFLKYSALASASVMMPDFLKALGSKVAGTAANGPTLVVVQLSGGNDGLNCLVPYRNDNYYKARPDLGLRKNELITLNDEAGFNLNLDGLALLYENGNLAIINEVGYPNPNRSHFKSMDIWHSASDDDKTQTGWVGRYLDSTCNGECARPHAAVEIDDSLSLAMKGERMKGLAFRNPESLRLYTDNRIIRNATAHYDPNNDSSVSFLKKTLIETTSSADYVYQHSKIYQSRRQYPAHEFGKRMKMISELICSGSDTKVYYVSLSGFDTHVLQKGPHHRMLKIYSDSIRALTDDLNKSRPK